MKRLLTKRGYAVQMPNGEYRGVYDDRRDAETVCGFAGLIELCIFDWPTVEPCRMWFWQRGGVRLTPVQ